MSMSYSYSTHYCAHVYIRQMSVYTCMYVCMYESYVVHVPRVPTLVHCMTVCACMYVCSKVEYTAV
jgi:hypothetical protein